MTVTDYIRSRLLCNVPKFEKLKINIESLKKSEWCSEFISLMRNRLIIGAIRYETLAVKRASIEAKYDNISAAYSRLHLYELTGNTEHLVDAANFCLIEFTAGKHPNKHFKSIDDGDHHAQSQYKD